MNNPKLLLPTEYVAHAAQKAKSAKKRIYLISLSLTRGSATDELIDAIIGAANRGVEVHIALDLLTFICDHTSHIASRVAGRDMFRTNQLRREFCQAGAEFHWLGMQRVPYLIGRTHSKWLIIDDDLYSFGGVNLNQSGVLERADYIFYLHDKTIANRLATEQDLIEIADPQRKRVCDYCIKTDYGELLIDGGRYGHSVIYNHAVKLAREAKELIVVSQYCPGGKLAKILTRKKASIYINPKGSAADAANNFMIGSKKAVSDITNLYTRKRYLHAKFIIATMPNGSKKAITGSHNFSSIGVHAGTREVALETSNPAVIAQLEDFLKKEVA